MGQEGAAGTKGRSRVTHIRGITDLGWRAREAKNASRERDASVLADVTYS